MHTFAASEVQLWGSLAGRGCRQEAAVGMRRALRAACFVPTWGHLAAHSAPTPQPGLSPSLLQHQPCPTAHSLLHLAQTELLQASAVCWHSPAGIAGLPCPPCPLGR